jgi:hypothetical protein
MFVPNELRMVDIHLTELDRINVIAIDVRTIIPAMLNSKLNNT